MQIKDETPEERRESWFKVITGSVAIIITLGLVALALTVL